MRHRLIKQAGLAVLVSIAVPGCSTSRAVLIRTSEPADMTQLNPGQGIAREFGAAPVRVTAPDGSYVLKLQNKPRTAATMLILPESEKLSGILDIKLRTDAPVAEEAVQDDGISGYGVQIDTLARVHRMILRGERHEAKALLDELAKKNSVGSPALYLRGLTALLDGNRADFSRYFQLALEQDEAD